VPYGKGIKTVLILEEIIILSYVITSKSIVMALAYLNGSAEFRFWVSLELNICLRARLTLVPGSFYLISNVCVRRVCVEQPACIRTHAAIFLVILY